jgi:ribosomal protein S18 acetylase RimI-like enzyme
VDITIARRIQELIRVDACRAREAERIGGLTATVTADDPNPFLNYAIPDEGATPSDAELRRFVSWYRERDRRPRLEYLTDLAPEVEARLLHARFEAEGRLPLMTCTDPPLTVEEPPGIELVSAHSDEELRAAALVQWEAYEGDGPVPDRAIAGLRRAAETGGVVALARDAETGEPVGAGLVTAPQDSFAELTSVGVRTSFRRRGIAAALSGFLAREALGGGLDCVFLMAMGEPEARIYERAGFVRASEVLHISLPR